MKTFILSAAFAVFALFATAAGTKEKTIANYRISQKLATEFGEVENLVWSSASNNMTRADFVKEGQQTAAFFTEDGEMLASTTILELNDLPKKLKTEVGKKLPGADITSIVHMISDQEDAYFIETKEGAVKTIWKGYAIGGLSKFKTR